MLEILLINLFKRWKARKCCAGTCWHTVCESSSLIVEYINIVTVNLIRDFQHWKTCFLQEDLIEDSYGLLWTNKNLRILALLDLVSGSSGLLTADERELLVAQAEKDSLSAKMALQSCRLRSSSSAAAIVKSNVTGSLRFLLIGTICTSAIALLCWWKIFSFLNRIFAFKQWFAFRKFWLCLWTSCSLEDLSVIILAKMGRIERESFITPWRAITWLDSESMYLQLTNVVRRNRRPQSNRK